MPPFWMPPWTSTPSTGSRLCWPCPCHHPITLLSLIPLWKSTGPPLCQPSTATTRWQLRSTLCWSNLTCASNPGCKSYIACNVGKRSSLPPFATTSSPTSLPVHHSPCSPLFEKQAGCVMTFVCHFPPSHRFLASSTLRVRSV